MMMGNRLWLGVAIGLVGACGGSEFSSSESTGNGGSTQTGTSSTGGDVGVSTTGMTGTTGATGNTTGGRGGAGTAGASGSGTASGGHGGTGGVSGAGGRGGSGGIGGGGGGFRDSGASDGSAQDGTVDPCPALRADLDAKLALAQACDPADMTQCKALVQGVCCNAPVAIADSQATISYNAALAKYRSANCPVACPQVLCQTGPTLCQPGGMATGGTCVFGLGPPPPP